jgi:hypothetical protein
LWSRSSPEDPDRGEGDLVSVWLQIAMGVLVLWLVVRFVLNRISPREPSESLEDPLTGVPSPKKRGPQNRSGAVALAEPDPEDENPNFLPRKL